MKSSIRNIYVEVDCLMNMQPYRSLYRKASLTPVMYVQYHWRGLRLIGEQVNIRILTELPFLKYEPNKKSLHITIIKRNKIYLTR